MTNSRLAVRQQRFELRCQNRQLPVTAWVLAGTEDGHILLRGQEGAQVLVAVESDGPWREVTAILEEHGIDTRSSAGASAFRRIYPVTVDAYGAHAWSFQQRPRCDGPVAKWGPVDPPKFREVTIDLVSHHDWESMSKDERRSLVARELSKH